MPDTILRPFQTEVAKGIALLNEKEPGWLTKFNADHVTWGNVLLQVFGDYMAGSAKLGLKDYHDRFAYGFVAFIEDIPKLGEEWKLQVKKLMTVPSQPAQRPHQAAVAKGITLLDKEKPGWRKKFTPETLNMASKSGDVLAQVYGDYEQGSRTLGLIQYDERVEYGFTCDSDYRPLTEEWQLQMKERPVTVPSGAMHWESGSPGLYRLQTAFGVIVVKVAAEEVCAILPNGITLFFPRHTVDREIRMKCQITLADALTAEARALYLMHPEA